MHYGFHAIRHWAASYLYNNERIGKKSIQDLLGHTNASTTDIYMHTLESSLEGATDGLAETIQSQLNGKGKAPAEEKSHPQPVAVCICFRRIRRYSVQIEPKNFNGFWHPHLICSACEAGVPAYPSLFLAAQALACFAAYHEKREGLRT